MENAAAIYNKARHHAFSLFHKGRSIPQIEEIMEKSYKLPLKCTTGLIAELHFYQNYRHQYQLSATLDCGDKADFSGLINGKIARIDVTTNLLYKNLDDYNAPIVNSDLNYYLAYMDSKTGKLLDLTPLNVPRVYRDNNQGRLIDLVILRGPDYDKDGCSRNNPYQELITFNTLDQTVASQSYN